MGVLSLLTTGWWGAVSGSNTVEATVSDIVVSSFRIGMDERLSSVYRSLGC